MDIKTGRADKAVALLRQIDCAALSYDEWLQTGMALKACGAPVDAWLGFSASDPDRYSEDVCRYKWESFDGPGTPGVGLKRLREIARGSAHGVKAKQTPDGTTFGWADAVKVGIEPLGGHAKLALPASAGGGEWHPVDEAVEYLEAVFQPQDKVRYVTRFHMQDDGRLAPTRGHSTRTRDELVADLRRYGDIASALGTPDEEAGALVGVNPVDGRGISDANVTDLRSVLVECDELPPEEQLERIGALGLPYRAVVTSGHKSVHAVVAVDARDRAEYDSRVQTLYRVCREGGLPVDEACRNPSRMTRLPGFVRGSGRQVLVATNCNPQPFEEWARAHGGDGEGADSTAGGGLPEPVRLDRALAMRLPLAPVLIDGVLRRGHKMVVAGPSKAGKSFLLMQLVLAIAAGGTWLGHACACGRVLYLNLEIDPPSCFDRFRHVADAMGVGADALGNVDVINLRGRTEPLDELAPELVGQVEARGATYAAIVIDPIYKVITGDENSATDMAYFVSQFDRISQATGAATVYVHHQSKGMQGAKASIDRMSGSGVLARDPDAILDMSALHATEAQLRACWDAEIEGVCRDAVVAAGMDGQEDMSIGDPYARALGVLGNDDKERLFERVEAIRARPLPHAFRINATLREFATPAPTDVWFSYPLHVVDDRGVLAKSHVIGEPASKEDKEAAFRGTFEKVSVDGVTASCAELAEALAVSERTIQRRVKDLDGFSYANGTVKKVA